MTENIQQIKLLALVLVCNANARVLFSGNISLINRLIGLGVRMRVGRNLDGEVFRKFCLKKL